MRRDHRRQSILATPESILGTGLSFWVAKDRGIVLGTPPAVATWSDQSGNGNHATQGSASLRPAQQSNGDILFDGTDDCLAASDANSLDTTTAFTIGFRYRVTAADGPRVVFCKASSGDCAWGVRYDVGFALTCFLDGTSRYGQITGNSIATWYSVIFVYDGSLTGSANRLKGWRNGVAQTLTFGGGGPPASIAAGSTRQLVLGRWEDAAQHHYGEINAAFYSSTVAADAGQVARLSAYLDRM